MIIFCKQYSFFVVIFIAVKSKAFSYRVRNNPKLPGNHFCQGNACNIDLFYEINFIKASFVIKRLT